MRIIFLLYYLSMLCSIYAKNEIDSLLIKGDGNYSANNYKNALELYYQAEKIDPYDLRPKEGIYNASINSGGIKTANDYAKKLLKLKESQINQDRLIYSDALLGKTANAEKYLRLEQDYFRKKAIFSLAGRGLIQTGYLIKTADWYKKAIDEGLKNEEFLEGYKKASKLLKDDNKYIDAIISFYDYGGNELLLGGYNLNLNYNFGPSKHKFNVNLVMQGTSVNKNMNDQLGFAFYDDISQYELFGQYNYYISSRTSFYTAGKISWLINDYVQGLAAGSIGTRFSVGDHFRANTFINASTLSYSTYTFNSSKQSSGSGKKFYTNTNSMTSLQYTFDAALTYRGAYLGGIINLVNDIDSDYAEDMLNSDRDTDAVGLSDNIIDKDIRLLYGATTGYNNEKYDIFSSFTTGDMFLVNTGEGRYLNTNDSELKMNVMGGVIFKKLFGDWILGYTLSYSDFENYTILTNSIIANYNWR